MAAKKNFHGIENPAAMNPALQFISQPTTEEPTTAHGVEERSQTKKAVVPLADTPAGYKPDYRFIETKSKQLKIMVQPSLFDKVKDVAAHQGLSMSEFINKLLREATEEA